MTSEKKAALIRNGILLLLVFSLPSCDKIHSLREKFGKKPPAATQAAPYAGELVSELTETGFDPFLQLPGRLVVVDFYADWCGPCRTLGPILHDIANEKQGLVIVGKVNVDRSSALAARMGVQSIPDVRIFIDGKQVDRFVGAPPAAEVRNRIEKHLQGLPPLPPEAAEPAKPAAVQPTIAPLDKDWLPPGMKRR